MKINWLGGPLAICVAMAFGLSQGAAEAAESTKKNPRYVTFGAQYTMPDSSRNADFGIGFSGSYASRFRSKMWWEFRAFSQVIETGQPGADFYQAGAGFDLIRELGNPRTSHAIAIFGAGAAVNDVTPNSEDGTDAFANVGLGWRFKPGDDWGFRPRVEVRAVYDANGIGFNDIWLNFAFEIPPKRTVIKKEIVEKVVTKEKIVEVPVEVIKEVEVAPTDTDGDGIPDSLDKCPNTLQGAAVGPDGCVRDEQNVTLPNIEFEPGAATLTPSSKRVMVDVLQFLRNQPNVRLDIYGHTDSQGSASYNLSLSQRRARSVLEFLVKEGIDATRLSSEGLGETQPVANNDNAEGRSQNRRVELRIRAGG